MVYITDALPTELLRRYNQCGKTTLSTTQESGQQPCAQVRSDDSFSRTWQQGTDFKTRSQKKTRRHDKQPEISVRPIWCVCF